MIFVDTREKLHQYITTYLNDCSVPTLVTTLSTGIDYLIVNGDNSIYVQRKTTNEIFQQMDYIYQRVIPALTDCNGHAVLLVEEDFQINRYGVIMRRENYKLYECKMRATAYFNFLNSVRLAGIDVVCTRGLDHSIWWMVSTHSYIGEAHYPKQRHYRGFTPYEQALGSLCCVNTIGAASATRLLEDYTIRDIAGMDELELLRLGLKDHQVYSLLRWVRARPDKEEKEKKEGGGGGE